MILGLMVFQWRRGLIGTVGAPPVPGQWLRLVLIVYAGCLAAVPVVYLLLSRASLVGYILLALFAALAAYFLASAVRSGDRMQLRRYPAMLLLFLAKILFWGMFEQAGSSLNLFARDHVDSPFDFGVPLFSLPRHTVGNGENYSGWPCQPTDSAQVPVR